MVEGRGQKTRRQVAGERSRARVKAAEATLRAELGLVFRLHALSYVITRRPRQESELHDGLSMVAWRVLMTVALEPGLSGNEIVLLWGLEKMGVSRAIATLVERGFVRQGEDGEGSRRIPLFPTEEGQQFFDGIFSRTRREYDRLGEALTPRQLAAFSDYSDALLERAREMTEKP